MSVHISLLSRVLRVALFGLAGLVAAAAAHAAPPKLAVVSLIGEKLEVVYPQSATGSSLDRNVRHAIDDKAGEFDRYVLVTAEREIKTVVPQASTTLIGVGASKGREQPELLFDDTQAVLPGALVDELVRQQVDYLVLISKHRGLAKLVLKNGSTGVGHVRGLGFYLDMDSRITRLETGAEAEGLLAPFAYFRASLIDVRTGLLVRDRKVALMDVLPVAGRPGAREPWHVLDSVEKVDYIKQLIERGLHDAVSPLLTALPSGAGG